MEYIPEWAIPFCRFMGIIIYPLNIFNIARAYIKSGGSKGERILGSMLIVALFGITILMIKWEFFSIILGAIFTSLFIIAVIGMGAVWIVMKILDTMRYQYEIKLQKQREEFYDE